MRSLGTTAVLAREKRWDSDSDSDEYRPATATAAGKPWFPPPPTATVRHGRVRIVEVPPLPVRPMPILPETVVTPPSPKAVPRKPLARAKSKRKTVMEFLDGWWDLGLLEQTLSRAASRKNVS